MMISLGNGNYYSQSEYCDFPDMGREISDFSLYGELHSEDTLRTPDELEDWF